MRSTARKTNVSCRFVLTPSRSCSSRTWLNGKSIVKLIKTALKLVFLQITRSSIQPTTSGGDDNSNGGNVKSNSGDHRASNTRRIQRRNESRRSQSSTRHGWNGKSSSRGHRNETGIAETSTGCAAGCKTGENWGFALFVSNSLLTLNILTRFGRERRVSSRIRTTARWVRERECTHRVCKWRTTSIQTCRSLNTRQWTRAESVDLTPVVTWWATGTIRGSIKQTIQTRCAHRTPIRSCSNNSSSKIQCK